MTLATHVLIEISIIVDHESLAITNTIYLNKCQY